MRIGVIPETLLERVAMAAGLVPQPFLESYFTFLLARTLMVATRLGVFEALAPGPLSAPEVAQRCGTDPRGTEKLLNALVGAKCLRADGRSYALLPAARKWLLQDAPQSCHDKILFQFVEWEHFEHCEEFVRTGQPLRIHEQMKDEEWQLYQRGMRSMIGSYVDEVVRAVPVPDGARQMLDIGGSHGYFSVCLCRRHPQLRATILDLPESIKHAALLLAREGMGDRVVHLAGDALTHDLGQASYDLVFISGLVHHFDAPTNQDLMRRIGVALRPGGVAAVLEPVRQEPSGKISQLGGLLDLYFAITSSSGTWSAAEIAGWQREAGLAPRKPVRLWKASDLVLQAAVKPSP
jgi:SAM-dependent methyltransferase